jgi:hypothetical protein
MRVGVTVVAALVLAACGASTHRMSKHEYALRAQWIEAHDEPPATGPFIDVTGHDLPKPLCVHETRQLHDALQKLVDDARELRPPPDLRALHARFLANAQQSVDAVAAAADDVERGRLRCGFEMNKTIYGMPSTDRAEQALEVLARRGVPLCITTCE